MMTKKLLNRVSRLKKVSKIISAAPLDKLNHRSLVLLHMGIEIELERLSKIFNDTAMQIRSPIRIVRKA